MELALPQGYKEIPSPWLYDFKKDVYDSYSRICRYAPVGEIPADTSLVDELMVWCHEAASLHQFGDSKRYLELENDSRYDEFYADSLMKHYQPFIEDVYKVAQEANLSLFVFYKNIYLNLPIEEVW